MPRRCMGTERKNEVLQIRLTKQEKELIFQTAEEYDFDSAAEMILEFIKIKHEAYKRKTSKV